MGLDINTFRTEKGGDPEKVKQAVEKRFKDTKIVDEIIECDQEWRKQRYTLDQLNKEFNIANKAVAQKKKSSKGQDPCTEEIKVVSEIKVQIETQKQNEQKIIDQLTKMVNKVGNFVHESVPISNTEDDNKVEKTWGTPSDLKVNSTLGKCHHHEILAMIDGYDPKRGSKIAGHRGYFLKGYGAMLNLALVNYGLQYLMKKGYTPMQTPYFMKKEIMEETCQLSDFEENLYKVSAGKSEDDDCYLIATSEQPISALYRKEWIDTKDIPIRYAGQSTCFRKEAGSAGKDNWGIFRVHQFEKVEQFVITSEEESDKEQERMMAVSEQFYQELELPYRVVNIVSGALNDAATRKLDLEAWFPGYNAYRELVSISNCTDYQSRALEIRSGLKKQSDTEKKYVHMLNGTLCATTRTLCCILENYQTETGVKVPKVLQPWVGVDFIPYTKPIPNIKDLE